MRLLILKLFSQAKEDATELLEKKVALEREKKVLEESAAEKGALLQKNVKTIGNYVHDSVPISNNEVIPFVPLPARVP